MIIFLITTVVLYLDSGKKKTAAQDAISQLEKFASSAEQKRYPGEVGAIPAGQKSVYGALKQYYDVMSDVVLGTTVEQTTAEIESQTAASQAKELITVLGQGYIDLSPSDVNGIGLLRTTEKLKESLDLLIAAKASSDAEYAKLKARFDDFQTTTNQKLQDILNEKAEYEILVNKVKSDYETIRTVLEQETDESVQMLVTDLETCKDKGANLNKELLKTRAQLSMTEGKMNLLQSKLERLVPSPDKAITAFEPDGKIILIDEHSGIVHLNLGSKDKVYRGLAFAVYDKTVPITSDGRGKAEIKVFDVQEKFSVAKVVAADKSNPIVLEDLVANLVWDSEKANKFVVTGQFDLNGDGYVETDGQEKIVHLIENWGGQVVNNVTIEVDFLVLGTAPMPLPKPTFEQIEIDPLAMQKYEKSLEIQKNYNDTLEQANTLQIPVFSLERFLYFIGYKAESSQVGAF
jgi:hypothetical protein